MIVESVSASTPTPVSGPASSGIQGQSRRLKLPKGDSQNARAACHSAAAAKMIDRYAAERPARASGGRMESSRNAAPVNESAVRARWPGSATVGLPAEEVQVVGHGRPPDPEDQDHQRQAEGDLGHRDADREHREHHAAGIAVEARERDEVDVHGVQHELDAEEDPDRVPASGHAEEPDSQQGGGRETI